MNKPGRCLIPLLSLFLAVLPSPEATAGAHLGTAIHQFLRTPAGMNALAAYPRLNAIQPFADESTRRLDMAALESRVLEMDGLSSAERFNAAYLQASQDVEAQFQAHAKQLWEDLVQGRLDKEGLATAYRGMVKRERACMLYKANTAASVKFVGNLVEAARTDDTMQQAQALATLFLAKHPLAIAISERTAQTSVHQWSAPWTLQPSPKISILRPEDLSADSSEFILPQETKTVEGIISRLVRLAMGGPSTEHWAAVGDKEAAQAADAAAQFIKRNNQREALVWEADHIQGIPVQADIRLRRLVNGAVVAHVDKLNGAWLAKRIKKAFSDLRFLPQGKKLAIPKDDWSLERHYEVMESAAPGWRAEAIQTFQQEAVADFYLHAVHVRPHIDHRLSLAILEALKKSPERGVQSIQDLKKTIQGLPYKSWRAPARKQAILKAIDASLAQTQDARSQTLAMSSWHRISVDGTNALELQFQADLEFSISPQGEVRLSMAREARPAEFRVMPVADDLKAVPTQAAVDAQAQRLAKLIE